MTDVSSFGLSKYEKNIKNKEYYGVEIRKNTETGRPTDYETVDVGCKNP